MYTSVIIRASIPNMTNEKISPNISSDIIRVASHSFHHILCMCTYHRKVSIFR